MNIKIEMSDREKQIAAVIAVAILIILYIVNKRYLYVIDVTFNGDQPESFTLKVGFIYPVKTLVMIGEAPKKINFYGYEVASRAVGEGAEIFLNNKKVSTIFKDAYYTQTKGVPTGRIYLA